MQFSAKKRSKGFALLITVTLLAFLVLLLVSLASLTRVETQVANNNQQLAQARQNALMALNIAIGELQKYTGPDQRTTARSDMADTTAPAYTTPSGRWTGAYGNGVALGGFGNPDKYDESPTAIQTNLSTYYNDSANASDPYVLKSSQARLLNWLVSGNESTTFVAATSGQITTKGTGITFTPADAVVLGGGTALSTDTKVKNLPARILVGPNSATDPLDYVAAPLVPISAVALGLGSAPVTVGNYAWWVGDEGAKARINLPMATAAQAPLAFVSSQRTAIELVDGIHPAGSTAPFATTDLIGPAYPTDATNTTDQAKLLRVMNSGQLPMLTPASATTLSAATKYRYHDLTGYSASVLSDTYAGGLKKDLSAVLAPLTATGATSPRDTDVIFTPEPTHEFGMPTWGILRDFVKTTAAQGGTLPPSMPVINLPTKNGVALGTSPTSTSTGIYPVMTYSAVGFQYGVPQSATMPADTVDNPIHLAIFPVVVLWNPYTTDIQAAQYEFGIKKTYAGLLEFQSRAAGNTTAWSAANRLELRDFGNGGKTTAGGPSAYFRFVIDSGVIPAGKSLVYTIQTNATYDTSNNAVMLANALKSTSYNPGGHLLMPSTLKVVATGATYRVGVNGATGTYLNTPVTFFTNTSCNFGGNISGGPGSFDSYLSPFSPTSTAPTTSLLPYRGTSPNFISQVYQQFSPGVSAPFNTASPYGNGGSGYAVSTVGTGLIQNEGLISMITQPSFRMMNIASFSAKDALNGSIRWIPTTNSRAYLIAGAPSGGNSASSFFSGKPPASVGIWPQGLSVKASPPDGGGPRVSSGTNLTDLTSGSATTGGIVDTTLFEFRPDTQPLMSLGQLQHANLTWANGYPTYLIGNSAGWAGNGDLVRLTGGTWSDPAMKITATYDLSWLLNRALWDKYFVSTVPHTGTGKASDTESTSIPTELPNVRHTRYVSPNNAALTQNQLDAKLRNADSAAASLLVSGGFNINSTSEQAWRAVLGGINNLSYDPTGGNIGGSASSDAVISRFSKPTTNASYTSGTPYAAWQGYRKLTANQIAQLAKNIVVEIRARGPFISLGDFINHRLSDAGAFPVLKDKRLNGALQAAIDASTVNSATTPFNTLVNDSYNVASTNALKTSSLTTNTSGAVVANVTAPASSTAAYAPQFLTQADVLSAVGSGLSARSDTFVIRTYGEVLDATNSTSSSPVITSRAWCEAIVQRVPDYVDPLIAAETQLHTLNPSGNPALTLAKTTNVAFGRKYKIISFRWLSSNDI